MKTTQTKEYVIISNQEILEEYFKYYFKKYPRRSKKPIDKPDLFYRTCI